MQGTRSVNDFFLLLNSAAKFTDFFILRLQVHGLVECFLTAHVNYQNTVNWVYFEPRFEPDKQP